MAYSFAEDYESSFFSAASGNYNTNSDEFFDIHSVYQIGQASDASLSHYSTSTDTNYLEDLSYACERDIFGNCTGAFPRIAATTAPFSKHRETTTVMGPAQQSPPKIQRLVHRMRPEGIAISNAQLLALENKEHSYPAQQNTSFACLSHKTPATPTTPPHTPSHDRMQSATLPKQSRRMHRADQKSQRSVSRPSKKCSPRSVSLAHAQQTPVPSPSFAEWTERLRRLAMESPQIAQSPPISPPPSTNLNQVELTHGQRSGLGINMPGVIFDSSSPTTIESCTCSQFDDFYPSAQIAASQNLDIKNEPFNIKQETWDFEESHASSTSTNGSTLTSTTSHSDPFTDSMSDGMCHCPLDSNISGMDISFIGTDDPFSNVFNTTTNTTSNGITSNKPVEIQLPPRNLPQTLFNSPPSGYCTCTQALLSPAVISPAQVSTTTVNANSMAQGHFAPLSNPFSKPISSSPKTPSPQKHRRARSNISNNGSGSGSGSRSTSVPTSTKKSKTSPRPRGIRASKSLGADGSGFVNYTPDDRARILTGVAPSGSSKTKARREMEAAEQRRRFSEAARRLVEEAGGDGEAVVKEFSV